MDADGMHKLMEDASALVRDAVIDVKAANERLGIKDEPQKKANVCPLSLGRGEGGRWVWLVGWHQGLGVEGGRDGS